MIQYSLPYRVTKNSITQPRILQSNFQYIIDTMRLGLQQVEQDIKDAWAPVLYDADGNIQTNGIYGYSITLSSGLACDVISASSIDLTSGVVSAQISTPLLRATNIFCASDIHANSVYGNRVLAYGLLQSESTSILSGKLTASLVSGTSINIGASNLYVTATTTDGLTLRLGVNDINFFANEVNFGGRALKNFTYTFTEATANFSNINCININSSGAISCASGFRSAGVLCIGTASATSLRGGSVYSSGNIYVDLVGVFGNGVTTSSEIFAGALLLSSGMSCLKASATSLNLVSGLTCQKITCSDIAASELIASTMSLVTINAEHGNFTNPGSTGGIVADLITCPTMSPFNGKSIFLTSGLTCNVISCSKLVATDITGTISLANAIFDTVTMSNLLAGTITCATMGAFNGLSIALVSGISCQQITSTGLHVVGDMSAKQLTLTSGLTAFSITATYLEATGQMTAPQILGTTRVKSNGGIEAVSYVLCATATCTLCLDTPKVRADAITCTTGIGSQLFEGSTLNLASGLTCQMASITGLSVVGDIAANQLNLASGLTCGVASAAAFNSEGSFIGAGVLVTNVEFDNLVGKLATVTSCLSAALIQTLTITCTTLNSSLVNINYSDVGPGYGLVVSNTNSNVTAASALLIQGATGSLALLKLSPGHNGYPGYGTNAAGVLYNSSVGPGDLNIISAGPGSSIKLYGGRNALDAANCIFTATYSAFPGRVYLDGGTDTYIEEASSDIVDHYVGGVFSLRVRSGYTYHPNGVIIGTYASNNKFDDASSGSASVTMYIGNQAIQVASDKRLKQNITDTSIIGLNLIEKLNVKDFIWNDPSDKAIVNRNSRGKWTGLIAQDVIDVTPWVVNAEDRKCKKCKAGEPCNEHSTYWQLEYQHLVPVLVKAIQEQQIQIKNLEQRLLSLEST